ncbi:hypothetical protein WA026_021879 [Henosepilachna vigintioctopunctata]|uniref:Maturase K n=1 Tax=Henosepilachna vigintioctopunctata TaxID=420089 RepID=A0AAW1UQ72_9CUCU
MNKQYQLRYFSHETFLKHTQKITSSNYTLIRDDRTDGISGIAIAIKNNLQFNTTPFPYLNLPERLQMVAIRIKHIFFYNLYIPPDIRLTNEILNEIPPHLLEPMPKIPYGALR